MNTQSSEVSRRNFIRITALATSAFYALGAGGAPSAHPETVSDDPFVVGPLPGYSPQIGTLVSMLNYNRKTIIDSVKNLTIAELDYLHDEKANTIGALVLHLGAIEKFYQVNTFEGRDDLNDDEKKAWGVAGDLGAEARKQIKGHEAKYYLDMIGEVRQKTLEELKKRDDKWLLALDPKLSKETPFNTYWKWFHVCEHESNHRGQITWLKRRLPGAKDGDE